MGEQGRVIVDAPAREVMIGFQTAIVERVRALLMLRIADRRGTDPSAHDAAFDQWTSALRALMAAHAFPVMGAADALELTSFERDVMLLAAAPQLDASVRALIAMFHRDGLQSVDCAFAIELLSRNRPEVVAARATLSDHGPLVRAGLVELVARTTPYAPTDLDREIVPSPRLMRLLDGYAGLDPRLAGAAYLVPADPWAHAGTLAVERINDLVGVVQGSERAIGTQRGFSVLFCGPQGVGKLRVAVSLAARCGMARLLVAEAAMLPTDPVRLGQALQGMLHEASLLDARLVVRGVDQRVQTQRDAGALLAVLRNLDEPVWATSNTEPRRDDGVELAAITSLAVTLGAPDLGLRKDAWASELYARGIEYDEARLGELVSEFPISRAAIRDVSAIAAQMPERTWATITALAELKLPGQLARFGQRGRSRATMSHLVLPDAVRDQLHELLNAVRVRAGVFERWGINDRHAVGRGIVALFNGPPGTGKTMAANAIANELGTPLFRIDTSSIVDRYVGETEKNLIRLFEEAQASRAALLFDEADSLFGKRVEAKDSVDRHANMQINVLLNLIEDYSGFVVLTTNMKGAMDSAFLRRIVFKIGFDLPDLPERVSLWSYHLPEAMPRAADVDLEALAREFDKVSGGDIKNAVLRAALATRGECALTQEMLHQAMANELRANGSVVVDGHTRRSKAT